MGVLILHGINVIFETVMCLWISKNVFQKRDYLGKKHILSEIAGTVLMLYIIEHNFISNKHLLFWRLVSLVVIAGILYFRFYIQKRMHFQQKNIRCINYIIATLQFGLATGILIWNGWLFYISGIMVLLGNMMMPFLIYRYFKCSFFQVYTIKLIYLSSISLLKQAYMVSVAVIEKMTVADAIVSGKFHEWEAVGYVTVVLIILLWFVKKFSGCKLIQDMVYRHKIILFLIGITEFQTFSWLMDLGENGFDIQDFKLVLVFTLVIVLVLAVFLIRIYVNLLEGEKKLLDVRNDAIEQQYEELSMAYQQNRYLIHDEKHMIQYLLECLESDDVEEAVTFARKYQENISGHMKQNWTGIHTLDFVINMKKRRMDRSGIEFLFNAQLENLPMEDTDFVVLLGNLFDNAIEATEKCEQGKREIHLSIKNVNELFLLQMTNTSISLPRQKKGQFLTSKVEKENHGLGIESVRRIVEKNQGTIDFKYDKNTFQVKIICSM